MVRGFRCSFGVGGWIVRCCNGFVVLECFNCYSGGILGVGVLERGSVFLV